MKKIAQIELCGKQSIHDELSVMDNNTVAGWLLCCGLVELCIKVQCYGKGEEDNIVKWH